MQYKYNRKTPIVTVEPASEPVTVAEIKDVLRVEGSDDDTYIGNLAKAAREYVENYLDRALITQTITFWLDRFNSDYVETLDGGTYDLPRGYVLNGDDRQIDLPKLPLQSVTSVSTFGTDNSETTYSSSNYSVDTVSGRIYLNEGETFPTDLRDAQGAKIVYVAGYGDNATDVPEPIRQAIIIYTAKLYETRGMCDFPCECKALLSTYKVLDDLWIG